jgi:hypothetical protein
MIETINASSAAITTQLAAPMIRLDRDSTATTIVEVSQDDRRTTLQSDARGLASYVRVRAGLTRRLEVIDRRHGNLIGHLRV